ncbi:HNH endonuclease [Nocardioides sp.]|uniref:HNH endonuclease n=1 Tax=Nocardioides sp. TaxID=35761 RepID=UPI00261D32BC|nr:HNH endonuclease [Nocardioides sp.]
MRRLIRIDCPPTLNVILQRRQTKVDSGSAIKGEWNSFRKLQAYRDLRAVLEEALGWRRRCAYCSDSLGADVEHFWPKEKFPGRAFKFENLCLICTPCNRKKTDRFPVDAEGQPALIDPFFDDPWDSVFFSHTTGWISARVTGIDPNGNPIHAQKGVATLDVLGDLINAQPVASSRRRSWGALVERFHELVTGSRQATSLQEAFGDIDDYGLAEWLIYREGKEAPEVSALRSSYPANWLAIRELPRT